MRVSLRRKIHLEDICGIIYVYMISIPCLCKYMATWVGKFTMGPWAGPGPGAGCWGGGLVAPLSPAMYFHKKSIEII